MKELNAVEVEQVAGGVLWQSSPPSNNVEVDGGFYGSQPDGGIGGSIGSYWNFYAAASAD